MCGHGAGGHGSQSGYRHAAPVVPQRGDGGRGVRPRPADSGAAQRQGSVRASHSAAHALHTEREPVRRPQRCPRDARQVRLESMSSMRKGEGEREGERQS
eukprot:2140295-Pyramimonas_sp.AAC.2